VTWSLKRAWKLAAVLGIWASVAAADPGEPALTGTIYDQSGGAVPGAAVRLQKDGTDVAHATSDVRGVFEFAGLPRGRYVLQVTLDGFETHTTEITTGARGAPLRVTLRIADLAEDVLVGAESAPTRADANRDAVSVGGEMLATLPALDDDPLAALAGFLDPGSVGSGGPMLVVDGAEASRVRVPPSAIAEVRINQNPYSAEYFRPGRGRVEIITKQADSEYHGSVNASLRDARLDAQDLFAAEKPRQQRRRFDGYLAGPVPGSAQTRFRLSLQRRDDDAQALVVAVGPQGEIRQNVPTPRTATELALRLDRSLGGRHSAWAEYALDDNTSRNQGVGGFALPDVATDEWWREHDLGLGHQFQAASGFLSQLTLQLEWNGGATTSVNRGARRVVAEAFTSGGAQADERSHAFEMKLFENVTWSRGKHLVKAGLQIADVSRRTIDDRTNREGTFYYATLGDYEVGNPYAFTRQAGNGLVTIRPVAVAGYVQDEVQLRQGLSVAGGARYDYQNLSHGGMLSPRVFAAYAPGKGKLVLRAGAGLFNDRVPAHLAFDVIQYDGAHLASVLVLDPASDDPAQVLALGTQPANLTRFASDLRLPYSIQYSLAAEWQAAKATTVSATYRGSRGVSMFRSRDVNAPLGPDYAERPDPTVGRIREIESAGRQEGDALDLAMKTRIGKVVSGLLQYTLSRTDANTTGLSFFPALSADPLAEWGPIDDDRRHRLNVVTGAEWRRVARIGVSLYAASGAPYTLTTGRDLNRDGLANERPPGVGRNTLRAHGYVNLDVRVARDVFFDRARREKGPRATLGLDVFNVLNHRSPVAIVGNLSSVFFGQAVSAMPARRLQLSARFNF
jgi:hypothetical protein